jgi:hypothetical protein
LGIDTDVDGQISIYEAESVTFLEVTNCDISDLTGLDLSNYPNLGLNAGYWIECYLEIG